MAYIHVTLAAKQYWKHTLAFHCCRLVSAALKQSLQRQMLAAIFWVFPLHHSSKDMTDLPSVNCGKLCASCLQYCVIWCFVRRFTTLSNPPHAAGGPLDSICLKVRSNFELRSDADTQSTISRRRRGRHDVLVLAGENLAYVEGEADTFRRFEWAFVWELGDSGWDVGLRSCDVLTAILYFTSRSL